MTINIKQTNTLGGSLYVFNPITNIGRIIFF